MGELGLIGNRALSSLVFLVVDLHEVILKLPVGEEIENALEDEDILAEGLPGIDRRERSVVGGDKFAVNIRQIDIGPRRRRIITSLDPLGEVLKDIIDRFIVFVSVRNVVISALCVLVGPFREPISISSDPYVPNSI